MLKILGFLLAGVFAALSLLHVFWAMGGKLGTAAIPTVGGKRTFEPSTTATLLVAAALALAMLTVLGQLDKLGDIVPKAVFRTGLFGIAALFFLRAVGEFRLVGFFKQVRDTPFAWWDTWCYSPLCLGISIAALLLALNNPEP